MSNFRDEANWLHKLRQMFGHTSFRRHQKDVIQQTLQRRDSLVVMATGAGKSICYQLAPLLSGPPYKPTLVVTPLISLGSDQTQALQQAGIPCAFLSSATTSALSSRSVWDDVESGKIALLYGCPETLLHARDHIVRVEQSVGWTSIAIDEAHCISDWGASFRPAYRQLNQLRQWMPSTPVIALTATATQTVRTDIIMHLGMKEPVLRAIDTFNRPNLFYQVLRRRTMAEDIKSDLFAGGHSALVYVLRQKDCQEVADHINRLKIPIEGAEDANGETTVTSFVRAEPYHAGMSHVQRADVHRAFVHDEVQVVVATLAFGMGIDKPDCRLVLHYGMPRSIETYYQQTGRASRDGQPGTCIMFCNDADIVAGEYHMHSSGSLQEAQSIEVAIQAMVKYANSTECRRAQLLRYFDEVWPHNECASCDNCLTRSLPSTSSTSSSTTRGPIDFTAPARLICQAVYFSGERFGFGVPLALLRGSKAKAVTDKEHFFRLGMSEMPCFGKGVSYSDSLLKSLARLLVSEGVLVKRCIGTFSIVILGESGRRLVSDLEFQLPPSVPTLDVQHHWMQFQRQAAAKEFSVITRQTLNEQAQSQYSRRPEQLLKARQAALDVAIIDDDSLTSAAAAESDPLTAPFSDVEVELLAALVSARKAEAHRLDQAPYSLCSQPVLELIVRVRPTSAEALESIPGLSAHQLSTVGIVLMRAVRQFVHIHSELDVNRVRILSLESIGSAASNPIELSPSGPKRRKIDTESSESIPVAQESPSIASSKSFPESVNPLPALPKDQQQIFDLFQSGLSISEMCSRRCIRRSTVESTLAHLIQLGFPIEWPRLGVSDQTYAAISKLLASFTTAQVADFAFVKSKCGAASEGDIRFSRARWLRSK